MVGEKYLPPVILLTTQKKLVKLVLFQDALARVLSKDFKTTSCPVVLDFLIRHGIITPDSGKSFC